MARRPGPKPAVEPGKHKRVALYAEITPEARRQLETLVRIGRHGREPGGWSVLLCDDGVVIRDYPCRDQHHAEAVAEVLRRQHRGPAPDTAARRPGARSMLHA